MERLDKFLADAGAGTRSQVKQMIKSRRVQVDGVTASDPGMKIQAGEQTVTLDGTALGGRRRMVVMLNKPAGYVTATTDPRDLTVMDLLTPEFRGQDLKPVGRLDKATEGLLLLTNDGDLLHRIISPKKQVPKVYYARHQGTADPADVQAFAQGLTLGDGTKCLGALLGTHRAGREPDHRLRGQIPSGAAYDGIEKYDRDLSGAQAGRDSDAGHAGAWTVPGTHRPRTCRVGKIAH